MIYFLFLLFFQYLVQPLRKLIERQTVLNPHIAHTRPTEGRQMGTTAQGLTDVTGQ